MVCVRNALQTRCIVLRTANLANVENMKKNADDADETWMVPEKRIGGKINRELSPLDPAKCLSMRNGKIGWTGLLLAHQFCGKVTLTKVKTVIY